MGNARVDHNYDDFNMIVEVLVSMGGVHAIGPNIFEKYGDLCTSLWDFGLLQAIHLATKAGKPVDVRPL